MDYKGIWMYYRAVIVSIIASIADMSSMYGLNKVENLSEPVVIGLSSLIGLFIQFFGQFAGVFYMSYCFYCVFMCFLSVF